MWPSHLAGGQGKTRGGSGVTEGDSGGSSGRQAPGRCCCCSLPGQYCWGIPTHPAPLQSTEKGSVDPRTCTHKSRGQDCKRLQLAWDSQPFLHLSEPWLVPVFRVTTPAHHQARRLPWIKAPWCQQPR